MNEKLDLLKNVGIPDTEIVYLSYEASGTLYINDVAYDNLPPFYRVRLCSKPGVGSCIYTEVWLPESWNGVFVGTGNVGMAGSIMYGSLSAYLKRDYAVANTDMGTSDGRRRGINNPDVWKDFGWRAAHIMTVAAKQLIYELYNKNADYSYFIGISTGGQQALSLAQRYPSDYDGIIAGVPGNNRTMLHMYFLWNYIHLRPQNSKLLFTIEAAKRITELAVKYFQMLGDGERGDNFITFPKADAVTINGFLSYLRTNMELSEEQTAALYAVYTGPVKNGKRIYSGMPIGSEKFGCGFEYYLDDESPNFYPFIWAFGEDYDGYSFDFDKDIERLNNILADDLNANNADLTEFCRHGGKMIIYSGSSDACVPFPDMVNYYNRVANNTNADLPDHIRYFLLAGKDHTYGGDGVRHILTKEGGDELNVLRQWREKNIAPNYLIGINRCETGEIIFERRIGCYEPDNEACLFACSDCYIK